MRPKQRLHTCESQIANPIRFGMFPNRLINRLWVNHSPYQNWTEMNIHHAVHISYIHAWFHQQYLHKSNRNARQCVVCSGQLHGRLWFQLYQLFCLMFFLLFSFLFFLSLLFMFILLCVCQGGAYRFRKTYRDSRSARFWGTWISIKMPLFVPQMGRREASLVSGYGCLARYVSRYSDGSENSKAVSYANSYKSRRYESRSILDSK